MIQISIYNNTEIFEKAHTLITVINDINDLVNGKNNEYLELIWEAKKVIAQKGIKNLNWIVVLNNLMHYSETDVQKMLYQHSKRYGYRMFLSLKNREAFKHIYEGLCIGDMIKTEKKSMTMNDLYAHREILKLTDFLWNYKYVFLFRSVNKSFWQAHFAICEAGHLHILQKN